MVAVHVKDAFDVRVDRKTRWGNPFPMRTEADRADVIAKHKAWLWDEIRAGRVRVPDLAALDGKRLGCHCAPRACHADTLTAAAAWAAGLMRGEGVRALAEQDDALGAWARAQGAPPP